MAISPLLLNRLGGLAQEAVVGGRLFLEHRRDILLVFVRELQLVHDAQQDRRLAAGRPACCVCVVALVDVRARLLCIDGGDANDQSSQNGNLEIAVRTNGGGAFATLAPRQALTPTPYAIYSANAASAATATLAVRANSVEATNLTGTIRLAQLPSSVVTNGASGVSLSGTFSGNGAGLTGIILSAGAEPPSNVTPILAMVWIKPATFVLGSPSTEAGRVSDEGPQTVVTISKGFWMGHHEVTQGEYQTVIGSNPSFFTGDLNRPVERVSWNNATNYCRVLTLSERTAGRIPAGWGYRLPTEAEWEYACRAWTTTRFGYGDDLSGTTLTNYAWVSVNSGNTTHPVAQKLANAWGLMDMHGNVLEWCQDWYGSSYPGGSVSDPQGPGSGINRVIRGGSWGTSADFCRSAERINFFPGDANSGFGFRVVLAPGQP